MNDLLELQQLLLLRNSDTYSIVGGKNVNGNGNHGDEPGSDEEIPSDFSDNEESDNTGDESSSRVRAREGDVDAKGGSAKGGRRKRKHRDWVRGSMVVGSCYFLLLKNKNVQDCR